MLILTKLYLAKSLKRIFFYWFLVTNWVSLVVQWQGICLLMQQMQETQVQSLGLEDPLEKEMATNSSILAWRIQGQRRLAGYSP